MCEMKKKQRKAIKQTQNIFLYIFFCDCWRCWRSSVLVPYVLSCANGHKNRNNWNWKSSCTNVRLQKAFRKTNQWKGENSIRWGGGWEILPLHLYVNLIEYTASGCLFGYLRLQYFQSFATKTQFIRKYQTNPFLQSFVVEMIQIIESKPKSNKWECTPTDFYSCLC